MYHEIHIFHWNSAKQYFIAQHHSAGKTISVLKCDLYRPDVRDKLPGTICYCHFPLLQLFQLQLVGNMLRNTKMQCTRVYQCTCVVRRHVGCQ